ncbi:minor tail protein [Arthrobacter phage Shepard]|nr:minor tail protein [Arthrobacter phage Shepard]UYL88218.1 minor tail protein [Arthrobacter phage LilHuddy]
MSPIPDDPNQAQAWISGEAPDQTIDFYIPRGNRGPQGLTGPQGPSLLVGTVETSTGPAVPGTIGPTGLTGPQGPAGGIVLGTSLGTADLNTIVTSGVYRQSNSSGADSPLSKNYPYNGGYGVLTVFETTGSADIIQEFRSQSYAGATDARGFYRRNRSNSVWSPWRFHATQRVDQTAGRAIYQWDDLNGREQLVYGDTGMRRVETLFLNGWTAAIAVLRRSNNQVSFGLYTVNPAAKTADTAYTIPTGFKPASYGGNIAFPIKYSGATNTDYLQINGAGDVLPPTGAVSGSGFICVFTWQTADAWPTTLPGSSSGSIPNL